MRLKNVSGQDLIVPEIRDEPVVADEIVEVGTALGRRMSKSPAWKVTSRDKGEEDDEEEGED